MNKQIKIKKLIIFLILVILIFLFLFFNIQSKKDKKEIKNQVGEEIMGNKQIKLFINNHELIATLNDNLSSKALIEELKKAPIMLDYANMEKVGDLGIELPRNDENITTSPGDLILYQDG